MTFDDLEILYHEAITLYTSKKNKYKEDFLKLQKTIHNELIDACKICMKLALFNY